MTGPKSTSFLRNFFYVFGSQMIVLTTGFVKAFAIPATLSISDYGYWQIYLFYTLYVGVTTMGYTDGLYLKYGGFEFQNLPFAKLRMANIFYLLLITAGCVGLLVFAVANDDFPRQVIFIAVALNIVVLGIFANIGLTLQAVNELRSYSYLISADKVFFTLCLFGLIFDDLRKFYYLIIFDLISKFIVLIFLLHRYRQLFLGELAAASEGFCEFLGNLGAGSQLLIANLCGMLIFGAGRIIVEYGGNIESYAHYAFAVSLASIVFLSVSALSMVMYPALKRSPRSNYLKFFETTNNAFLLMLFLMLYGFFPAVLAIDHVFEKYQAVIGFLAPMFVVIVLQGKMVLVNNTFFKALRLETQMLFANLSALVVVCILATTMFLSTGAIVSIVFATLFTILVCVYASEFYLRRKMGGQFSANVFWELGAFAVFLVITTVFSTSLSLLIWMLFSLCVAILKRDQILSFFAKLRNRDFHKTH